MNAPRSENHDLFHLSCEPAMLDQLEEFVLVFSQSGGILYINLTACEILGFNSLGLTGKPLDSVFQPMTVYLGQLKESRPHQTSNEYRQAFLRNRKAELILLRYQSFPVRWMDAAAVLIKGQKINADHSGCCGNFLVGENEELPMAVFQLETGSFTLLTNRMVELLGKDGLNLLSTQVREWIKGASRNEKGETSGKISEMGPLEIHHICGFGEETQRFLIKPLYPEGDGCFLVTHIKKLQSVDFRKALLHQLDQQTLVANISQKLSDIDFYTSLDLILEMLGTHTGVSRVYIFEDSEDESLTSNTFEWCNKGIIPQIDELKDIPYEIIPSWKSILRSEGCIFSTNIQELPRDLFDVLAPQGIISLLIFPIIVNGRMIGFIGFDECSRVRNWERDEIDLLRSISIILSNAFERRAMMNRIRENESRLELAMQNSREGIWDWNIMAKKLFLSDQWYEMFGYTHAEVDDSADWLESLIHPDDLVLRKSRWGDHEDGITPYYDFTIRIRCRNGDWKWVHEKGKIISYASNGQALRAIGKHSDITEIKLAEEKLKVALEKEKELNELKSRFVSNASHELRTPLASIMITSDSLRTYWSRMNRESIESRLENIQDRIRYLTNVVNDILEISRLQGKHGGLKPESFDLVNLCEELLIEFNSQLDPKHPVSVITQPESIGMMTDKKLMTHILCNLLSNAIKYSNGKPEIILELSADLEGINIVVSDRGIGIPASDHKHLFEPFFRASNTEKVSGSGLGLSIVKESVDCLGGQIELESSQGNGTRVIVTLPSSILFDFNPVIQEFSSLIQP